MEDDYLHELFERAAGDEPSAPEALAVLRPRIRRAQRRRATVRGGAGLVVLVVLGGLISSTTTDQSRDVRVGGSGTTAVVESTTTSVSAPTSVAAEAFVPGGEPQASPTTTIARPAPGGEGIGGGTGRGAAAPQSPAASPEPHTANKIIVASKAAGPGQASAAGAVSSPTSVTQTSSSGGGAPQVTSFDAQGGSVEVSYTDSSMSLGVVSPSPGWSIANTQSNGDSIQVTFAQESGGDPVDVDVHLDGGKPVADSGDTASTDVSTPAGG